jgi:hypothetical protein
MAIKKELLNNLKGAKLHKFGIGKGIKCLTIPKTIQCN